MTFFYNANQAPATAAIAMFNFKELLKSVGWTGVGSGDGTSFSTTTDIITSGNAGANGFANTNAWVRLRIPLMSGVNRELTIQRIASNLSWRIKYSYSAGFSGGSTTATRTPSATDEQIITGAGTDASPTGATIFASDGSYKYHCAAADSTDGYMFYSVAYAHNAGACTHLMFMDQMQTDSVNALDVDGYVFFAGGSASLASNNGLCGSITATNLYPPQTWFKKNLTGETFGIVSALTYAYVNAAANFITPIPNLGVNAFDGKDIGLPVVYARVSSLGGANSGFKGIGRLLKLAGSPRSSGTPLDFISPRDRIQIDNIILPWNGSIPIV